MRWGVASDASRPIEISKVVHLRGCSRGPFPAVLPFPSHLDNRGSDRSDYSTAGSGNRKLAPTTPEDFYLLRAVHYGAGWRGSA